MTRIHITGEFTTLLTHCALWGTASILADALGSHKVRAGWISAEELDAELPGPAFREAGDLPALLNPRAVIEVSGASETDAGEIIRTLAERVSRSEHWSSQISWGSDKNAKSASLLTPRTGLPEHKEFTDETRAWWQTLEKQRTHAVDSMPALEQNLARALGERSWWLSEPKGLRADLGASPWEMKTRNRGEEFLGQRFLPLAQEVAKWSPAEILEGLRGQSIRDTVGKNKADSRTATGMAQPGPCDNALAWCALWAISLLQPIHRTQPASSSGRGLRMPEPSLYAGRIQARKSTLGQETLVAAVPTGLVSVPSWARLQDRPELLLLLDKTEEDPSVAEASRELLRARGVREMVAFPVSRSSNPSAPERRALQGQRVL